MTLGCCGDLDRLDAIASAGFDYVEPPIRTLIPAQTDDAFTPVRDRFQAVSVPSAAFNVFLPGEIPVVGPRVDNDAVDRHVAAAFSRCQSLDAEVVVFGSGGARGIPDGWPRNRAIDQVVAFLSRISDPAEAAGITIAIEPLTREACNFINSVPESVEISRLVHHPRVKVLADLYHMERDDQPITDLDAADGELVHVHVPVPALPETFPDAEPFQHALFMAHLKNVGYDGRISIEDNARLFSDFTNEALVVHDHVIDLWKNA